MLSSKNKYSIVGSVILILLVGLGLLFANKLVFVKEPKKVIDNTQEKKVIQPTNSSKRLPINVQVIEYKPGLDLRNIQNSSGTTILIRNDSVERGFFATVIARDNDSLQAKNLKDDSIGIQRIVIDPKTTFIHLPDAQKSDKKSDTGKIQDIQINQKIHVRTMDDILQKVIHATRIEYGENL